MRGTFPVKSFPWRHYLVPLVICLAAVAASLLRYDALPDRIPVHFDLHGNPNGWMTKGGHIALMSATMFGLLVFVALLDRFIVYPGFPVPLMSAIGGSILLILLVIHLGIIGMYGLQDMNAFVTMAVMLILACIYFVFHMKITRASADPAPEGQLLWTDTPPFGLITKVLFFIRPIFPSEIAAYEDGIVLRSSVYAMGLPWKSIVSIEPASLFAAIAGMAMRIASSPAQAVKIRLEGTRWPIIVSVSDIDRLIGEWQKRKRV